LPGRRRSAVEAALLVFVPRLRNEAALMHVLEDDLIVDMGWILIQEIEHYLALISEFQTLYGA
jgi:hypothetical protein